MAKITLYIEDTEIKLLVAKGTQIEKWASLLLEPSLVRDGVIVDEDQVAERIQNLLKLTGVNTKKVSVGLSGLNSIFRIITLPELTPSLVPEALMNEARRVIPVPLDQVYLSHQQIESSKGETRFFLVAYPRNSTDVLVNTLQKAGLKPDVMDLAPLALARCANQEKAVIINSWLTYIDIIIMTDRIPTVIRSLSLPTEAVAVEEKLPTISEELTRTIAFYNTSNPTNQLDAEVPVFVSGDLAEAKDSWETLAGKAGYQVSALQPPVTYPETFSPGQFMVNTGLSLKEQLKKEKDDYYSIIDINALPEVYRPVAFNIVRVIGPVAIAIGIGALLYGGLLVWDVGKKTDLILAPLEGLQTQADFLNTQISNLNDQIANSQTEVDGIQQQIIAIESEIATALEAIVSQQEQVDQQQEANLQPIEADEIAASIEAKLDSLGQGLDNANKDIKEAVDLLPETITLLDLGYSEGLVSILGQALTEDNIFNYARELRNSSRFNEVIISSITEIFKHESGEDIRFFSFVFVLR
jgi:type IV pilus assembly protein PilM